MPDQPVSVLHHPGDVERAIEIALIGLPRSPRDVVNESCGGQGIGGGTTSERIVEWLSFIMNDPELDPAVATR